MFMFGVVLNFDLLDQRETLALFYLFSESKIWNPKVKDACSLLFSSCDYLSTQTQKRRKSAFDKHKRAKQKKGNPEPGPENQNEETGRAKL